MGKKRSTKKAPKTSGGSNSAPMGNIDELLDDLVAYPIPVTNAPTTGGGSAVGALGTFGSFGTLGPVQAVGLALREILGREARSGDVRGFRNALQKTFTVVEVAGRTEVRRNDRGYVGDADLGGGVTGAQLSLFIRASTSLQQALPGLETLYTLDTTTDPQLADASRALVRRQLEELVDALKAEGGPTAERIETLLAGLFGTFNGSTIRQFVAFTKGTPDRAGSFGSLARNFGLIRGDINDIDEESNYSAFLTVFDVAVQIRMAWESYHGDTRRDLGAQLVRLSRALSVATETVQEIYAAMDSVFVGPAERQVATFQTGTGTDEMLVSDFLGWAETFTREEGPGLVQEGGRASFVVVKTTATRLKDLATSFLSALTTPGSPGVTVGMRHPRVRHPVNELIGYLEKVVALTTP